MIYIYIKDMKHLYGILKSIPAQQNQQQQYLPISGQQLAKIELHSAVNQRISEGLFALKLPLTW